MQVLSVILLIAASASSPQAVAPPQLQSPPGIVIVKWSWHEHSRVPGNDLYSPVPPIGSAPQPGSRDPFSPKDDLEAARKAESITVRRPGRDNRPVKWYEYRVKVKNTGSKRIKSLSWDYIVIEPANEGQLAHHNFRSAKKISPGKTQQLSEFSVAPPSRVVNVGVVNKTKGESPVEGVIITRIEYADGSLWQLKF
ncbi:MAG TPA: hypothetical protein VGW76_13080 [Pyrinomonadaceae bacterium]|nr:hypothetical protein [Pyrinomonadaceae bacterium]